MKKNAFIVFIFLAFIGLAASSVYFFMKYKDAEGELNKRGKDQKQEVIAILDKVGKLIELPTDEEPTVATVTDKEKLKEQKFFSKAENEDKVIIFVKSQKAILYRPAWNKVIEVARIDTVDQKLTEGQTVDTPVAPKLEQVSLTVLNGTSIPGLSNTFIEKTKIIPEIKVGSKVSANKTDYQTSLLVDLSGGKYSELIKKITGVLGIDTVITTMPEGEATPSSKLVVILGSDFGK